MAEEKINWNILNGNLNHQAMTMAFNDPEYQEEIKPISDLQNAMNRKYNEIRNEIFKRYKDKYYDQLTAEYDTQVKLVKAAMDKIKAEDPNI